MPKCLHCGTITKWRTEPLLTGRHWLIGGLLMLAAGSGLIYLGVVALIRTNKNTRAKTCPKCKAANMWTFQY